MIIDIDKKCKTRWRAICGTATIRVEVTPHYDTDVAVTVPLGKQALGRIRRGVASTSGMGVEISIARKLPPIRCGEPRDSLVSEFIAYDVQLHIQTRDTTPLDKVFARIKDEYGVEIDFTETPADEYASTLRRKHGEMLKNLDRAFSWTPPPMLAEVEITGEWKLDDDQEPETDDAYRTRLIRDCEITDPTRHGFLMAKSGEELDHVGKFYGIPRNNPVEPDSTKKKYDPSKLEVKIGDQTVEEFIADNTI